MPSPMITVLRALNPGSPAIMALTLSSLVASIGRGTFITISVVFFSKSVGLTATQVGVGMTIAAVIGLLSGVPAGYLADRIGPRTVTVVLGCVQATVLLGYTMAKGFVGFVVVATVVSLVESGLGASRGALIAGAVPPEVRVRTRAYLRSVTNVGWVVGALPAGWALAHDTRNGYLAVIWLNAALFVASALLNLRVPAVPPQPKAASGPRLVALRDKPFVTLTLLNAVLCIHYGMLNIAVPLWIIERTSAPAWVVAAATALNAVVVVVFQVRASRGTGDADGGARAQRASGFLLLAACLLYALAAGRPPWIAAAVLIAGALVHVLGELRQAAGGWGISFSLAPEHAQGQYQGLYNMSFAFASVVAPAILTTVVVGWGWPGWLLFGLVFAGAGAAVPAAVRWAQRSAPELVAH
ncbi:MFS transporter [Longispora sp. NPDC051575]|uniref:MFS transporter n=1 Tax=Longispora sp. NPDC051575 TaxID=3154943 RepID=UPI00342B9B70